MSFCGFLLEIYRNKNSLSSSSTKISTALYQHRKPPSKGPMSEQDI